MAPRVLPSEGLTVEASGERRDRQFQASERLDRSRLSEARKRRSGTTRKGSFKWLRANMIEAAGRQPQIGELAGHQLARISV